MLADVEPITTQSTKVASALRAIARATEPVPVFPPFIEIQARLQAAEADWNLNADRTDTVKADNDGREITAEDERVWEASSTEHWAAVDALLAYRPRDVSELARKAQLLSADPCTRLRAENELPEAYLADAKGLSERLTFTAWDCAWEQWQTTYADWVGYSGPPSDEETLLEARWMEADRAMLRTPAPHVGAAAEKLRNLLTGLVGPYTGEDIDDPRYISALLGTPTQEDADLLHLYQALLRLAGRRPEIAHAKPYEAAGLLAEVEAAGGKLEFGEGPFFRPTVSITFDGPADPDLAARIAALIPQEVVALVDSETRVKA